MKSCDQNSSGKVGIIEKFMDRRRRLHLRQPGGNPNHGKKDKIGMDGTNGKNQYRFLEQSSHFPKFTALS